MKPFSRWLTFPFVCFLALINLSFTESKRSGILTDHHGIVTDEDIERELRDVLPECWQFREDCPTNYWFCLPLDEVSMNCEQTGDELDDGQAAVSPRLHVGVTGTTHEFSTRRPWTQGGCEEDLRNWSNLFDGQNVACFAGQFFANTTSGSPNDSRREISWQIDRVKSHKGIWSYFCDGEVDEACEE